jgi:DNA polymerase elongation subunit (family B)
MYQNIFIDRKNNLIHLWDDERGKLEFPLDSIKYAYRKKNEGTYKSLYGDSLEKVYKFNPRDPSLFESDVPLETRALIDLYEDNDEPSEGHRVMYYDIETSSEGGFPDIQTADKEITAIALYDSLLKKYTVYILDKESLIKDSETDICQIISCSDEESLLSKFLTKLEEIQPTIWTGWNIDGFDNPYLYRRISRVLSKSDAKRLSPIQTCYINPRDGSLTIAGVSSIDYMVLYKKYNIKQEASYALGAIGKKVVGMDKINYKGSLDDLYKSDINGYIDYNLNDVKIVVALEEKLNFIEQARQICHKGHVPYNCYSRSSRFIEGAILMYLRRKGLVAKNKPVDGNAEYLDQKQSGEEGFEGAYVKDPVPGRYDWVFDLDLTSMYPNIIISLNISPETKMGVVENWNNQEFVSGKLKNIKIEDSEYTPEKFLGILKKENYSIASNGVIYKTDVQGVIPEILVKWFNERKELRKLAKKHGDAKEWDKYAYYDRAQKTVKVQLNSIYGVLGLPIFRFYDKDNASAVTLTGQDIIKTTDKAVNQYFKSELGDDGRDHIIYCDTDSVFASALPLIEKNNPEIDVNDEEQMTRAILAVAGDVQEYVNKFYDVMAKRFFNLDVHRFDIKQEVIAKTSFWLAKKRYAQFIINNGGVEVDELEVKGIDVVRTSFPIKFKEFMLQFLQDILKKVSKDVINKSILDFKDKMPEYNIFELAKNTSVKFISQNNKTNYNPNERHPFNMVKGTPAQVKAALYYNDLLKLWKLDGLVEPILHGQKIKWVYLKQNQYGIECIALKADDTDPDKIIEFVEKYIDKNAMYEQELKGKLEDFYKVLKWDFPNNNLSNEFFSF